MVLLSPQLSPVACLEFEAEIYLLFHTNHICKGFQTVIHVGNVRQTAIIIKMNKVPFSANLPLLDLHRNVTESALLLTCFFGFRAQ